MSEIEIDGQLYRCDRLPTRVQLHVVKRLAPVLQGFIPLILYARDRAVAVGTNGAAANGATAAPNGADGDGPNGAAGAASLEFDRDAWVAVMREPDMIVEAIASLTRTIGMLSDADADFILDAALAAVRWRQGERWVPLRAANGALMLQQADDLAIQLQLTWEVLVESVQNFSRAKLPLFLNTTTGQTAGTA
jgi:hypothetical protein